MATSLRAPVIPFKTGFVPSLLGTSKLKQDFIGGSAKDKKCPTFSGEHGIEALLYVEERFRKIATHTLLWTTGPELFDGFEEVLLDTALTNWEDLTSTIADADRTPARFELTLQAMYRKYVGAEARDVQFEYFRTIQKTLKSSPLEHSSRMLTLARYGNKLPGNEPPLTDEQVKKCIFNSFPLSWQQQFIRSGQRIATTSLSDIIEFMSNEKIFADTQHTTRNLDNKKKSFSNKESSGDSFKKRKSHGKSKFSSKRVKDSNVASLKPDTECPIHGGHPWVKCFDNPQGESYKPRGSDGLRATPTGGRGRGRGGYHNPGRGHAGNAGRGNGNGRGSGQYSFHASKPPPATDQNPNAEVRDQHHFDQISKVPDWGWDADDVKPSGD
jgi:hypothetical protein